MAPQPELSSKIRAYQSLYRKAKKNPAELIPLVECSSKALEDVIADQANIACKVSCAHCCYLRVVAYPAELAAINYYINTQLSTEIKALLIKNIKSQYEQIKNLSISEHYTTNIACPMLDENKRCAIYPVRPLSCAGYHSESVEACEYSFNHPHDITEDGIPPNVEATKQLAIVNTVAKDAMEAEGDDTESYELIKGMFKILQNPKALQRWKSGKKMFKS